MRASAEKRKFTGAPAAPGPSAQTGTRRMNEFRSPALRSAASVRPVAPRPVRPAGILHFTLSVTDLERARKFYEEVVGATFWRRNDTSVFMRCGEQYFVLARTGYHTPQNRERDTLVHHAFMFAGEDFDAALAHVEACGVEVLLYEDKGHRSFTGRHAYFHDPDGNAIEFIDFHGIGDTDAPAYEGRDRRRARSHLSDKTPA
jgi:catechol 2,3-dioxygenase-like lactoylglutathione lyase family enzyme